MRILAAWLNKACHLKRNADAFYSRPAEINNTKWILRWHDIQTMAAVFYLSSFGSFARSSLYSRQADVSGFWCHRLERPTFPLRICSVTRGFSAWSHAGFRQVNTLLFSRSYQDIIIWLTLTLLPFITTIWTSVVLAIIRLTLFMPR